MRVDKLAQALLITGLLAAPCVGAQNDAIQWYAVEVVIFDQRGAAADDGERWPKHPALPVVEHPLVGIGEINTAPTFGPLAPGARRLNGVRRKLANTAGYQVISHLGWRQPGLASDAAPALTLPEGWQPPAKERIQPSTDRNTDSASDNGELVGEQLRPAPGTREASTNPFVDVPEGARLFGSVRAYRERYLHLEIDLRFSPTGWQPSAKPAANADDALASTNAMTDKPTAYSLRQERRLRSGEIHYLDNPVIGIIAMINPVSAPADAASLPNSAIPEDG